MLKLYPVADYMDPCVRVAGSDANQRCCPDVRTNVTQASETARIGWFSVNLVISYRYKLSQYVGQSPSYAQFASSVWTEMSLAGV